MATTISIGAVGGVEFDTRNNRWKGILTPLHRSVEQVHTTLKEKLTNCVGGSRVSIRVLTTSEVELSALQQLSIPWQDDTKLRFEAAIPVYRHDLGSIIYFGANTPKRRTSAEIRSEEWRLAGELENRVRKDRILPTGFKVEILRGGASLPDILQLRKIYQASYTAYITPFDAATIGRMIEENYVAVVRDNHGKIVSVSQAEYDFFSIGGETWRLVELADTATDPEFRNQGLSEICKRMLIHHVRNPRTVIFAESRANFRGVQINNHNIGMHICGRLEKHCIMDSDTKTIPQEGIYANIFVFHYPL